MKTISFFLFALVLALSAYAKNDLKPYEKAAIATRFAAEVKYNFAQYDKFGQDFDSICRAELPNLVATSSDEEFGRQLSLFANQLKDGHTSVSWSADVTYAPILQKRIGDKVFVTSVFSDEYTNKGVKRGTEIIAINDMPVIEYGNQFVVPYIASSTPQWSASYPFNSTCLTKGPRGESIKLTFKNCKGKQFDIIDTRQSPWGIVNPNMKISYDSLPGNIGLLTIPSFQSPHFNIEEFAEIFENNILPNNGLIIDIRQNTGGNSKNGEVMMRLLASDSIPQGDWQTPQYEAAYASWGRKWREMNIKSETIVPISLLRPDFPKYEKPIILLVSGNTFSAAEDFAALFRNAKRGLIIGTPTGGSTGNPINIDLGWGYYARICTRNELLADGTEFIGIGIQPDIVVEETESVIFGEDNVIQKALELINTK